MGLWARDAANVNDGSVIAIHLFRKVVEIVAVPRNVPSRPSHVDGPIGRILEGHATGVLSSLDDVGRLDSQSVVLRLVDKVGNIMPVTAHVESTALVIHTDTIRGAPSVEGVVIVEAVVRTLPRVHVIQRILVR